jgi:DNA ligase-1
MSSSFESLAKIGEDLENTRKRLVMIDTVAKFLQTLQPEEIEPAVSMLVGRPFQKWSPKTLEVSWATISEIVQRTTQVEWNIFEKAFRETGDVGSATETVFEKSSGKRQTVLLQKELTILEVRHSFESIAEATGSGSRQKKERLLLTLLSQCNPLEAKYLVKILIGDMRTGFHEGLMEQAVSKAFQISP